MYHTRCVCFVADTVSCVCVCVPCSHRLAESSTLPGIAADLKSILSALGIAADKQVDFILIRDDLVAREVMQPHYDHMTFIRSHHKLLEYIPALLLLLLRCGSRQKIAICQLCKLNLCQRVRQVSKLKQEMQISDLRGVFFKYHLLNVHTGGTKRSETRPKGHLYCVLLNFLCL